jgi:hypothetical protein
MKKMVVGLAVLVLTFVALRRFGPALGKRAMAKCQEMMASHQGAGWGDLKDRRDTSKEEPAVLAAAPV